MAEVAVPPAAAAAPPPPAPPAPAAVPAPAAAAPAAPPPPAAAPPAAVPAAPAAAAPPAPKVDPPAPAAQPATPKAATPADVIEIQVPQGAKYDPAVIESFKAVAKEHGLTSKQAQALIELDAKTAVENRRKFDELVQTQRAKDEETLKADTEFGGGKFDKTVADARKALKYFFGEGVSKLLESAGLDKHPDLVKGLARASAAVKEDDTGSRLPGTKPAPVPQKAMTRNERWKQRYLPK